MGLAGVDDAPCQDQVERAPKPDDARQALRAAVDQRHAPTALGIAELRALGGDPQVTPQRQLQPAGKGEAGDRGDRRLGGSQPREPHRPVRRSQASAKRLDRLEVGPGAKCHSAGAGEHHRARILFALEAHERRVQRLGGSPVDGVAPLGTVDADHGGRAVAFVADRAGAGGSTVGGSTISGSTISGSTISGRAIRAGRRVRLARSSPDQLRRLTNRRASARRRCAPCGPLCGPVCACPDAIAAGS